MIKGLREYRYLKKKSILYLFTITLLVSMLFSITALSLVSFYKGFAAYLGEDENIVVIYNRRSMAPFTGLIPLQLIGILKGVEGIVAVSPEVIVPCIIDDKTLFLRGVILDEFIKINNIEVSEGGFFTLHDLNHVIVGRGIAKRLNLKPGDRVIVLGVVVDQYIELVVKGVFMSNTPLDDEIIAPLHIGQWLRGVDYEYVSFIRVRINRKIVDPSIILRVVSNETAPKSSDQDNVWRILRIPLPITTTHHKVEDIGVELSFKSMEKYLEKHGLTREILVVYSTIVFVFASISIVIALKTLIVQHRVELSILRSLGVPRRILKIDLLFKLIPWLLIASIVGILLTVFALILIQDYHYLTALTHTIVFHVDPLVVLLNLFLIALLVLLGIVYSEV